MKPHASKVGTGGIRPLVEPTDSDLAVDNKMLSTRGKGFARTHVEKGNGKSMGTKVSGSTQLKGGSL